MLLRPCPWLAATSLIALATTPALAAPTPRPTPVAGSIVAAKGGEELRFVREGDWRSAELRQDLIGGDALRTNAIGNLAILFADQTQIRVGRNSNLVVNEVAGARSEATQLDLQSGQVWARASRGGTGVDVKTPAATAAIRGTDWSLSVDGPKTSLIVLEGVVELKNPQGSVTVRQGEGAVATIGQAPTKFVLVNSNDREQMLFYYGLRDGFTALTTTVLQGPSLRAERARIQATAPGARTAEDWLVLAEAGLSHDGRAAAASALAEARRFPLQAGQRARADLVQAFLLGGQRRWSEAAPLFARAERGLKGEKRSAAAYGRYIAASMADPKRVQPEPSIAATGPTAVIGRAFVAAFRQDLKAAADIIKAAEKQYPTNTQIAVSAAQVAFLLNRREEMRAALERARALDPDDPSVLTLSASVRAMIESDVDGALVDLRKAAATAPGRAEIWNGIGLVESGRDATLEAEAAFKRAIAEDPDDPVAYSNLAIHILDQNRVDEASALIDKTFALDPDFHAGYVHRGRLLLQKGRNTEAIEAVLSGTAANPAYSQGLLMAAVAYYQNGDYELAEQALDNADRLDPSDPVVPLARTAYNLDLYRADDAILSAREALKRYRARGGYFAPLAVNRQGGSYVADAYRFIGLDEWGRFYGDRVFNAFDASSYFDQAAARRPKINTDKPTLTAAEAENFDVTSFNFILQGLFFDPLAVSGRLGRTDVLRRPFLDAEAGGSVINRDGKLGWQSDITVNGFSNLPIPTSFSLNVSRTRAKERNVFFDEEADSATLFIGMQPTAADRILLFGSASDSRPGLFAPVLPSQAYDRRDGTSIQAGGGWSHTFGYRNVLTAALFYNRGTDRQERFRSETGSRELDPFAIIGFPSGLVPYDFQAEDLRQRRTRVDGAVATLGHTFGIGDLTLRYGAEGQVGDIKTVSNSSTIGQFRQPGPFDFDLETFNAGSENALFRAGRLYADAMWRPSDRFELQGGAEYSFYRLDSRGLIETRNGFNFIALPLQDTVTSLEPSRAERDDARVAPRIGAAFSPVEGHWFRAAYRQDTELPIGITLSPLSTVGLVPNELPTSLGGRTETAALRWDAEWHPRFFTAVEYQHQNIRGLDLPITGVLDTLALERGRIDRVQATANLWLGYGIGLFGTVGAAETENLTAGDFRGQAIPFIAERFARFGATFTHPSRLKFTLAATYAGDRTGDLAGTKLDDYWSTDAALTWETPDRRLLMGLTVLNLFDTSYDLAPAIPGPGRTIAASLKARF
ncbi:MAG TPA: tetratricopeptide repeat protein [Microvirga sp.]|jgi:tetratricopeptide (TPR) repeat protein|nr:tetratricopeptide repeat protein [Microvirga sp.]